MKKFLSVFKRPVFSCVIVVIPFVAMELINGAGYSEGFPFPLFMAMGLVAMVFFLLLFAIGAQLKESNGKRKMGFGFFARVIALIPVGGVFIWAVIDQMPCFRGMPNCD